MPSSSTIKQPQRPAYSRSGNSLSTRLLSRPTVLPLVRTRWLSFRGGPLQLLMVLAVILPSVPVQSRAQEEKKPQPEQRISTTGETPGKQTVELNADRSGRIYVACDKQHPVIAMSAQGRLLGEWGKGLLLGPHGLRVQRDTLWVTDIETHMAHQFTLDGKLIRSFGEKGKGGDAPEQFNRPTDFAFGPDGAVYISDGYKNTRVVCYAPEGTIRRIWGEKGDGLKEVPRGAVKKLRLLTYHYAYQHLSGGQHRIGTDGPWELKHPLTSVRTLCRTGTPARQSTIDGQECPSYVLRFCSRTCQRVLNKT